MVGVKVGTVGIRVGETEGDAVGAKEGLDVVGDIVGDVVGAAVHCSNRNPPFCSDGTGNGIPRGTHPVKLQPSTSNEDKRVSCRYALGISPPTSVPRKSKTSSRVNTDHATGNVPLIPALSFRRIDRKAIAEDHPDGSESEKAFPERSKSRIEEGREVGKVPERSFSETTIDLMELDGAEKFNDPVSPFREMSMRYFGPRHTSCGMVLNVPKTSSGQSTINAASKVPPGQLEHV